MTAIRWTPEQLDAYRNRVAQPARTDGSLLLPYPVSANRYWRHGLRGRKPATLRSDEANEYKARVSEIATAAGCVPWEVAVEVWITLHPRARIDGKPSDTRMDLDNCIKVALDACQGALYVNDRQVESLHASVGEPMPDGGLTVRAQPYRRAA